jgi:ATP/ADP translocase
MGVEDKAKSLDLKGVMLGLIISSFSFVMALFWRDAIKETIVKFVPEGEGLTYMYIAAIIVTAISVTAIYVASWYMKRSIIRGTISKTLSKEAREKTKKRLYGIDNKLIGRDIKIRNRKKKQGGA